MNVTRFEPWGLFDLLRLEVVIPKQPEVQPRRITVQAA